MRLWIHPHLLHEEETLSAVLSNMRVRFKDFQQGTRISNLSEFGKNANLIKFSLFFQIFRIITILSKKLKLLPNKKKCFKVDTPAPSQGNNHKSELIRLLKVSFLVPVSVFYWWGSVYVYIYIYMLLSDVCLLVFSRNFQ